MATSDNEFDVIIIGAGPAGSIASAGLRQSGKRVVVLEMSRFPRFVIGESLLPYSNDILKKVGLLDVVHDAGFLKKEGARFFRGEYTERFKFSETSTENGWSFAYQVPRADFDSLLIEETAKRGVDVRFGAKVTEVAFSDNGVTVDVSTDTGENYKLSAAYLIDCSGYGRALPHLLKLDRPSKLPTRRALFTHITGDQRPMGSDAGDIWIVVLPQGGWIWVIPFSNGKTSVGVVGAPELFESFAGDEEEALRALLTQEPMLAERLSEMKSVMPVQRIDDYSIAVDSLCGDRYLLTGNAAEFLDPVFSSGVTLAMASAYRAQEVIVRALEGETVHFAHDYEDMVMQGIDCFRTYVRTWYNGELHRLFFNVDKPEKIKRAVCSVLAGYVWDENNTFAVHSEEAIRAALLLAPNKT